ncbi:hypothetical protein FRC08_005590 [Ceratobasidium sp. 394]|nr:hypothetical protein FRC08_005590 [Ceratobasidium sp. 394]
MAHPPPGPSHHNGTPAQVSSEPTSYAPSLLDGERAPLLVPEELEHGLGVQYRYGAPHSPSGLRERQGKDPQLTRPTATLQQQAGNVKPSVLEGQYQTPDSTWGVIKMRSKYYVPALEWLPNYSLSLFWGDLAAGVTLASLLIPMSMSYASGLARLDPLTGLFAAALPGFIYAFFGSSRQLNVGPEAALSLLVGQAVTQALHGNPKADIPHSVGFAISTMITFQVGCISFVLGLLRLGFIDVVLSRALLRGFVTAVAVVITIEQLIPMLGLAHLEHSITPVPVTTLDKFLFIVQNAESHTHWLTAAISFGTLVLLLGARAIKRRLAMREGWQWVKFIPEVFVAVVVATDAVEDVPGLLIVRVRESLDFANTGQLKERLRRLELYGPTKAHPSEAPRRHNASIILFHMSDVESIDASAVQIFKELCETYHERGVRVFFAHLRERQKEKFDTVGIGRIVGEGHFTETVADAMSVIEGENAVSQM